ncbi:MAG: DUF6259 domain-containing protein [Kiritimatiellae bacterium]|nr:DUF6259 domain-containing protein [Kiritimatiellia bacterium]
MLSIENEKMRVQVAAATGAITSLVFNDLPGDLVGEPRLAANFRLCLPLDDYQCNYIEGMEQKPESVTRTGDVVTVRFSGMTSTKGTYPIDLEYALRLEGDTLIFQAKLTNRDAHPISEFWFPRLGGWTRFGAGRDARMTVPGYQRARQLGHAQTAAIFREFPCGQGLGGEGAEWTTDYPGMAMTMPWLDLYDAGSDTGLYLGYHDTTCRYSTWHTALFPRNSGRPDAWIAPDEAAGLPVGLVFSHVRYPFIHSGESLDSGEFVFRVHRGDWHHGSRFYREWFMTHFPFDKSKSWLRKKSAWFTSIIYQPEDRIVADYVQYERWAHEAQAFGVDTCELIGWDKGGLERDYPEYVPEPKLGGREGFRTLLKAIASRGGRCLPFVNYNVLDQHTEWYKRELHKFTHQEYMGSTANWFSWGESTLLARKENNARRHLLASVVPPLESILEDFLLEVVKDGASGFQIDKLCEGSRLDFNPLNTLKPDVALCEGLVQAIARLHAKCRALNPDFCLAAEAGQDRLLPYVDVSYRNTDGYDISPLRYVFPEWTSCRHISSPFDFAGVNGAVLTGAVICVEPFSYQGSLGHPLYRKLADYIREVERIRSELADIIFLGTYYDTLDAEVTPVKPSGKAAVAALLAVGEPGAMTVGGGGNACGVAAGELLYRVHGHRQTDRRALVVVNPTENEISYHWKFLHRAVAKAELYAPFEPVRKIDRGRPVQIKAKALHILVDSENP